MNIIVFSKDRACQLELFLRSMNEFFVDVNKCKVNILYKVSDGYYKTAYNKLKALYAQYNFVEETNFKDDLIKLLDDENKHVCFFVDDMIWKEKFTLNCYEFDCFKSDETILCLSLRLHKGLTYCYANNVLMNLPNFISTCPLIWNWKNATYDWAYPFSVDGHIFRKDDIKEKIINASFTHPNNFEASFYSSFNSSNKDKMICLENSVVFNNPINKVQNFYPNRSSNKVSTGELNQKFLDGYIISMDNLRRFKNISVHQEVDFELIKKENTFKIIVPCYNVEKWIDKTIASLLEQTYNNWQAIIMDDCSTDSTLEKIKNILKETPQKNKFIVKKRTQNVGAILENHIACIKDICKNDEDIIVLLDGDDWLYSNDVLAYLNEVYKDENIWLTYGDYKSVVGHKSLNKALLSTRNYRKQNSWCTTHLKTFKYKLWKGIKDEDLKFGDYYFKMTGDMAIMYPLIEMAGLKRIKYINKILYVYNDENPLNEYRRDVNFQLKMRDYIQAKKEYDEL